MNLFLSTFTMILYLLGPSRSYTDVIVVDPGYSTEQACRDAAKSTIEQLNLPPRMVPRIACPEKK